MKRRIYNHSFLVTKSMHYRPEMQMNLLDFLTKAETVENG